MPKKIKDTAKKGPKQPLNLVYRSLLDSIEKEYTLDSTDLARQRLSTGLLAVDMMLGGGLSSGFTVYSGLEGSGKSTAAAHLCGSALEANIPIIQDRDVEGAVDATYTRNIWRVDDLKDVLGQKDNKGNWLRDGRIRYYDTQMFEKTWNSIASTLRRLPDKKYRIENDQWYYVLEPRNKRTAPFEAALGTPSQKLKQTTGLLWYPCETPWPQAVIVVDSLPVLIPEEIDEKEEDSNKMAYLAGHYAKALPKVVGYLRRKHAILLGINQLKERPATMFGSPYYETAGNTIKYASSCRNQIFPRAVPQPWQTGKGSQVAVEKAIIGDGFDEFQWKFWKNGKNKFASPYLDCWQRVWIKDSNNEGRGFDRAFDAWQAFQLSSLAVEERKAGKKYLQFVKEESLPRSLKDLAKKRIEWQDFKLITHAHDFEDREIKDAAAKKCRSLNINPKLNYRSRLGRLINSRELLYTPIPKGKDDD